MHAPAERLDWRAIKDHVDVEAVAVALLGEPPGRGGRGLWWHCPLHDDRNPSFNVDPQRGRWKCFGCGESGDAVELVMRLSNTTFLDAVQHVAELAGVSPLMRSARATIPKLTARASTRPPKRPSGLPHADALALVSEAAGRLWTPEGAEALAYLHNRGLNDETIRRARLGYVRDVAIPTRDGNRSYRASGVVVSWFDGDRLTLAKIRQPEGKTPKYIDVFRDGPKVFPSLESIRPGFHLTAVEGEFDCLLLAQEIGDKTAVVTLGSATSRLDSDVRRAVRGCSPLFVATDADEAGDKAARLWGARAIRVRPPQGCNDWTDVHTSGRNRIRYLWGRHLLMAAPRDELATQRWGPALRQHAADEDPASKAWLQRFDALIGRGGQRESTY